MGLNELRFERSAATIDFSEEPCIYSITYYSSRICVCKDVWKSSFKSVYQQTVQIALQKGGTCSNIYMQG